MNDLISRQAAIDALGEEPEVWSGADDEVAARGQWRIDKAAIEAVPTVKPKKGKWIKQSDPNSKLFGWYTCSECGAFIGEEPPYCSNCGARMEEENED